MEVCNFDKIKEMAKHLEYTDKWVCLQYSYRKKDHLDEELKVNRTIRRVYTKLDKIDIKEVAGYCIKKRCRCYLQFMDGIIISTMKAFLSSTDRIEDFLGGGAYETFGLHLIDADDMSLVNTHIGWLQEQGIPESDIFIFKSKTGKSIVFLGSSSIIHEWKKTGWNEINTYHMLANINLYIPDFDKLPPLD